MVANNPLRPATFGGEVAGERARVIEMLARRDRFRVGEALPWALAIAAYFVFPNRMVLGGQTLIMILFALSLDLILGYAGIVTLGQAAFFGLGAYSAALLVVQLAWTEPIFLVEQNSRLALDISPRTVVMNRGKITYDGPSDPLKQNRDTLDRLIGVGRYADA